TALQAAAEGGHFDIVGKLLAAGANINADPAEDGGWTVLQAAVERGHLDIMERLLAAEAITDADPVEDESRTALQAAALVKKPARERGK
ncbi:hypothetical protein K469DRAFT_587891, partial [Zopfia rhizophila CBS 207.26]